MVLVIFEKQKNVLEEKFYFRKIFLIFEIYFNLSLPSKSRHLKQHGLIYSIYLQWI